MKIEKYGIVLESLTLETAELIRTWRNDTAISRFMDFQETISVEQQKQWFLKIQQENSNYFLIRKADVPIGMIHLEKINLEKRSAHVGLFIADSNYQGTGIALSASLALLEFAFESLKLKEVLAKVKDDNTGAIAYNQSLGFVKHEKFNDDFSYWLLTAEMFNKKKNLLLKYVGFI